MAGFREPLNIIITGVGGQGNVLASQMVSVAAAEAGFRVTVGETFGVSQRGGSVMSHVRISSTKSYGPLIPRGKANIIAGFEPLETLRIAWEFAGPETVIIMNNRPNYPLGCLLGESSYPDTYLLEEAIKKMTLNIRVLPATDLAKEAGSPLAANMVMTGALSGSGLLPFDQAYFIETIEKLFSGDLGQLNLRAFQLGFSRLSSV